MKNFFFLICIFTSGVQAMQPPFFTIASLNLQRFDTMYTNWLNGSPSGPPNRVVDPQWIKLATNYLMQYKPDIICLQELPNKDTEFADFETNLAPIYNLIKAAKPYGSLKLGILYNKNNFTQINTISFQPFGLNDLTNKKIQNGFMGVIIKINSTGETIGIICTHFKGGPDVSDTTRAQMAQEIKTTIQDYSSQTNKWIVCGDFNREYNYILPMFPNLRIASPINAATEFAQPATRVIDAIFYSYLTLKPISHGLYPTNETQWRSSTYINGTPNVPWFSDHAIIWANFTITPTPIHTPPAPLPVHTPPAHVTPPVLTVAPTNIHLKQLASALQELQTKTAAPKADVPAQLNTIEHQSVIDSHELRVIFYQNSKSKNIGSILYDGIELGINQEADDTLSTDQNEGFPRVLDPKILEQGIAIFNALRSGTNSPSITPTITEHPKYEVVLKSTVHPNTIIKLQIIDIVTSNADAIVNAANAGCTGGGGIDWAITDASQGDGTGLGGEVKRARANLPGAPNRCPTGQARVTISGLLKNKTGTKYIIHATAPDCRIPQELATWKTVLGNVYYNILDTTLLVNQTVPSAGMLTISQPVTYTVKNEGKITSIAIPSMGTGIFTCNLNDAATIATKTIADFIKTNPSTDLKEIRFVFWDLHAGQSPIKSTEAYQTSLNALKLYNDKLKALGFK